MKKIFQWIRARQRIFYLAIFLVLISSAFLLYPAAKSNNQVFMGFFLALMILANALAAAI